MELETVAVLGSCERDERGLIKGMEYVYRADGRVDWKGMLKKRPEFLYVLFDKKDEVVEKYGANFNIEEIDEKYLCISLPGIEYLAWLRGYLSAYPMVTNPVYDSDYEKVVSCTATYQVTFIGNYETGMQAVSFGHGAGANLRNTFDFSSNYIETIAINRAWSKTIRMFLGINIVSREEVGPQDKTPSKPVKEKVIVPEISSEVTAQSMLKNAVEKKLKLTFEEFKAAVKKKHLAKVKCDMDTVNSYDDIPSSDCFTLLGLVSEPKK